MTDTNKKQTIIATLSLFTSVGTLLCCALPALLVTLGLGATLAGLISNVPWITAIAEYKTAVFIGAGIMLCLSGIVQWKGRNAPCPVDPLKAKACKRLRIISWSIWATSCLLYLIGFFFAFLAADIFFGS
jgi:hypothetical protein